MNIEQFELILCDMYTMDAWSPPLLWKWKKEFKEASTKPSHNKIFAFHLNSPFISLHLRDLKYQQRPNWQFERSRASLGSLLSDLNSEPSSWRTRL